MSLYMIAFCFAGVILPIAAVIAVGIMDIVREFAETRPAPARASDKPGERA